MTRAEAAQTNDLDSNRIRLHGPEDFDGMRKAGRLAIARQTSLEERVEPVDADLTPMTRLSLEELTRCRYRVLRQFAWTDRLIYRLRVRGVSSSAIADRLGLTDRAVRMRFAKTDARIRLRMRQIVGVSFGG